MRLFTILLVMVCSLGSVATVQSDEKTVTKFEFTKQDKSAMKEWGLSESDWKRYTELTKGQRSFWSPNLDPITTLGVEAESDSERERFALMWAKIEFKRAEKEVAFENEVKKAFTKLYPSTLTVRYPLVPISNKPTSIFSESFRTLLFAPVICPSCKKVVNDLIRNGNSYSKFKLDIFILEAKSDADIRMWAKNLEIATKYFTSGDITLNHDKGTLSKLGFTSKPVPLIVRRYADGTIKIM